MSRYLQKKLKIDSKQIETAIYEFEERVDFELVPVITQKSSYTEHIGWILSLLILVLFLSTIDLFFQDSWQIAPTLIIAMPFLAILIGHLVAKVDFIARLFISKHERSRQTHEKAQRIFYLKHLNELKRHNSMVLFISVFERKIIILPDPQLQFEGLTQLQTELVERIKTEFKKGEYQQGFIKAIAFLKSELAQKFPKNKQNSENQISNKLIWWND